MKPLAFQVALHGAIASFIAALALFGYDRWIARPERMIGVVDLNAVYREKETEFTRTMTDAATDAERDRALQAAREFARRLPVVLEALPQECQCLVLLRSSVAASAPDALDLTPLLRRELARADAAADRSP